MLTAALYFLLFVGTGSQLWRSPFSGERQGEQWTSSQHDHTPPPCCRWREGAESASSRAQERLQQVERESSDTILALRGKLSALEASKSSEIARQEDTHQCVSYRLILSTVK